MSEKTFFRGHIDSKILAVNHHVIKVGQIVDHSINKTRSIFTVLIILKQRALGLQRKYV